MLTADRIERRGGGGGGVPQDGKKAELLSCTALQSFLPGLPLLAPLPAEAALPDVLLGGRGPDGRPDFCLLVSTTG